MLGTVDTKFFSPFAQFFSLLRNDGPARIEVNWIARHVQSQAEQYNPAQLPERRPDRSLLCSAPQATANGNTSITLVRKVTQMSYIDNFRLIALLCPPKTLTPGWSGEPRV
jgi:hypothetical protein